VFKRSAQNTCSNTSDIYTNTARKAHTHVTHIRAPKKHTHRIPLHIMHIHTHITHIKGQNTHARMYFKKKNIHVIHPTTHKAHIQRTHTKHIHI